MGKNMFSPQTSIIQHHHPIRDLTGPRNTHSHPLLTPETRPPPISHPTDPPITPNTLITHSTDSPITDFRDLPLQTPQMHHHTHPKKTHPSITLHTLSLTSHPLSCTPQMLSLSLQTSHHISPETFIGHIRAPLQVITQ